MAAGPGPLITPADLRTHLSGLPRYSLSSRLSDWPRPTCGPTSPVYPVTALPAVFLIDPGRPADPSLRLAPFTLHRRLPDCPPAASPLPKTANEPVCAYRRARSLVTPFLVHRFPVRYLLYACLFSCFLDFLAPAPPPLTFGRYSTKRALGSWSMLLIRTTSIPLGCLVPLGR